VSFQGNWLGKTSGDWFGVITLGSGIVVRIFKRVAKARTHSVHKPNYILTPVGGGLYSVVEYSSISQDKPDGISYEGYEFP
jgi:hypothetical protein